MGLFDFVSNIGNKLFNKEEEASSAVTAHLNADNPGVENVEVKVENGIASITGVAATAAAVEKAVLMTGNIAGIASVNIDNLQIANGESLGGDDEFYVIEKAYGNGAKYTAIVDANKEVIKDADKIFPGQKIRIPKGL